MTYPLSSDVTVGQATEASQYNNLRAEALYLGGASGVSGTLRDLLYLGMSPISLNRYGKTMIVLDTTAGPCAVMIGGSIYAVEDDLALVLDSTALPSSGRYFVYAVGANDGTFTITAGLLLPSGGRLIGSFLWDGSGIVPGTLRNVQYSQNKESRIYSGGRLTLVAGDPVPDTDISIGSMIYYTPYQGNVISLYMSGAWEEFEFSELSFSLSGLQKETPYDLFLSADSDGLKLSAQIWGTSGARPSGTLQRIDGVLVSGSDPSRRYLGSFVLNASGYAEDSRTGRLLWNENNRVARPLLSALNTSASAEIAQDVWAPYFGADAPAVRLLVPGNDTDFQLTGVGISSIITQNDASYGRAAAVGIGQDMAMESPYTGNSSCVPVFVHTSDNGAVTVSIHNTSALYQGYHVYTLAFWTNYQFTSSGTDLKAASGECPGLYGIIQA